MKKLPWFEIARSGLYRGHVPLTKGMFEDMKHRLDKGSVPIRAQVKLGHLPKGAPAYGWISALDIRPNSDSGPDKGYSLFAEAEVQPELYEALQRRLYTNRSIGIAPQADGGWSLDHLAFLGAEPPAIKGMQALNLQEATPALELAFFSFAVAAKGDGETITFAEDEMKNSMRPWLMKPAENDGGQAAKGGGEKHEPKNETFGAAEAKEFAELKAANAKLMREFQLEKSRSFCADLLRDGHITPAMMPGLAEFMSSLDDSPSLQFTAADKAMQSSPADYFRNLLGSLPKQVEFGESFKTQTHHDEKDFDKKIFEYAEKHNVTYAEAIAALTNE